MLQIKLQMRLARYYRCSYQPAYNSSGTSSEATRSEMCCWITLVPGLLKLKRKTLVYVFRFWKISQSLVGCSSTAAAVAL